MQGWGLTAAGAIRFRCAACAVSTTRKRPDRQRTAHQSAFVAWLLQGLSQQRIATDCGITPRALRDRFAGFWDAPVEPRPALPLVRGLVLDATGIQPRRKVVLVAQDVRRITVSWAFAERESHASWVGLLTTLRDQGITPRFVVCDAHAGLLKALREVWPQTLIQRCLIHVVRQARLWLTQHPKTLAAQQLLALVKTLPVIRTRRQKRRWVRAIDTGCDAMTTS